jgi:hypothetical protein
MSSSKNLVILIILVRLFAESLTLSRSEAVLIEAGYSFLGCENHGPVFYFYNELNVGRADFSGKTRSGCIASYYYGLTVQDRRRQEFLSLCGSIMFNEQYKHYQMW